MGCEPNFTSRARLIISAERENESLPLPGDILRVGDELASGCEFCFAAKPDCSAVVIFLYQLPKRCIQRGCLFGSGSGVAGYKHILYVVVHGRRADNDSLLFVRWQLCYPPRGDGNKYRYGFNFMILCFRIQSSGTDAVQLLYNRGCLLYNNFPERKNQAFTRFSDHTPICNFSRQSIFFPLYSRPLPRL